MSDNLTTKPVDNDAVTVSLDRRAVLIHSDVWADLSDIAAFRRVSVSQIIRESIQDYLQRLQTP